MAGKGNPTKSGTPKGSSNVPSARDCRQVWCSDAHMEGRVVHETAGHWPAVSSSCPLVANARNTPTNCPWAQHFSAMVRYAYAGRAAAVRPHAHAAQRGGCDTVGRPRDVRRTVRESERASWWQPRVRGAAAEPVATGCDRQARGHMQVISISTSSRPRYRILDIPFQASKIQDDLANPDEYRSSDWRECSYT